MARVCRFSLAVLVVCGSTFCLPSADAQVRDRSQISSVTGYSDPVIDKINEYIRQGWSDNEIKPSGLASDEEWLRRVYLDIVGHIPPAAVIEDFMKDKDDAKRARLIDKLLDDPAYVRNWATIWTNHCIGRGTPRRVSRTGMSKFFREVFARERPWDEVVVDIITAEGHFEKNGAVNFILAQMQNRDEAVQLTAKATRLFLGMQVQCTQCHNHPFNEWKQDQFWQLNTFFRQTGKRDHRKYDPDSGRMVDDYSEVVRQYGFDGKVFFEKRSGLMQVAYPIYFGKEVDLGADADDVDLREQLGKLMVQSGPDNVPWIAKAKVNRMWGHMFGFGFTRPVDDMGPHNPASHPELFDYLAQQFVENNYNVKQLVRWIANSEAYNLGSQFASTNQIDDPAAGETPLFSHMYVKSMEAEQLYNSLIVATSAHKSGGMNYEEAEGRRNRWMQQFVVTFGTDENDESTTFNGSIPQALMMMNGELIQDAVKCDPGSFLHAVVTGPGKEAQKVQKLYWASLTRSATRNELQTAAKLMRSYPPQQRVAAWQDLFWALLNSNEFIFNH